jgi:Domain of unknown function (DUF4136)
MKRWLAAAAMAASVLALAGCSSAPPVIRSNVTTFHEWPDTLPDKTYVFERTKEQDNSLEYRSYENLVRGELNRLGFTEAAEGSRPSLKAAMNFASSVRDVRVIYPVVYDPYWRGPAWRGFRRPYYDPFWYGPPTVEEREANFELYTRSLRLTLAQLPTGKQLYETTVVSQGQNPSLATVMPYMVRAAFTNFPGRNGVTQQIDVQMQQ